MGNRAVGGVAGAGCGAISLASILVGVALVVWLAGQAFDGTTDASRSVETGGEAVLTVPRDPEPVGALQVAPNASLIDGQALAITGEGLPPGPIAFSTCLSFQTRAAGAEGACDTHQQEAAEVSADGTVEAAMVARRVISVLGSSYDCAAFAGACSVIAHATDSLTSAPAVALDFAPDPSPVDATIPPRG